MASAREKFLTSGHPQTLHRYWARRPLAACRAIIFASLVDDPVDCAEEFPTLQSQIEERDRLHRLLSDIVVWKNTDERTTQGAKLMRDARYEVARSLARSRNEKAPTDPEAVLKYLSDHDTGLTIYDPFCGGGSIPMEAQRLGLKAVGSDLNPISVLITKSTIELPVPFSGQPPVNSGLHNTIDRDHRRESASDRRWRGYAGLAADIRHYGSRVRDEVSKRIGHLYPTVTLEDGTDTAVIAWLWANTVPCHNPACTFDMPLIRHFQLSKHKTRPRWIKPIVDNGINAIRYEVVREDPGLKHERTVSGKGAVCLACNSPIELDYVRAQASAGNMRQRLIAIVAEGDRSREFLPPNEHHERRATNVTPPRRPFGSISPDALGMRTRPYGLTEWHHLFTDRQITSLCTFTDVLGDLPHDIRKEGGSQQYSNLIKTYLSLAVGRLADAGSRFSMWVNAGDKVAGVFGRAAIGMVWDFAESNPFCHVTQNWMAQVEWVSKVVERLPTDVTKGHAFQADAANYDHSKNGPVIVTDPPYYDNIGYADISDFFYVWHNEMLRDTYPELFGGTLTPKLDEIIAGPRFEDPRGRFERLMAKVLTRMRNACNDEFPSSIFYAYKQKEKINDGISSAGWESFLTAINNAGFTIVGTWPIRTEHGSRMRAKDSNSLASSVVLVTRPRARDATITTRQQFISELEAVLPSELDRLIRGDKIAPIDLAQAAIGPGMEVYTKYSSVETIAGDPVPVRDALIEINRVIGDYFLREQGELDEDTRFCLDWLRSYDFSEGPFDDAEKIAKAKNVITGSLQAQGILMARGGKVQLLPVSEWGPGSNRKPVDPDTSAWVGCMKVAYHFSSEDGEGVVGAAEVVREMGRPKSDQVERLARIMFDHYDREFQPANSRVYNDIADAWSDILDQARYGRQLTSELPV